MLSLPFKEPMGFISSQSNVMEAPVIKSKVTIVTAASMKVAVLCVGDIVSR